VNPEVAANATTHATTPHAAMSEENRQSPWEPFRFDSRGVASDPAVVR